MDADGFGPADIAREIDVSRETFERLDAIIACLDEWRSRMNLIGPAERAHLWRRHVWDSLQLLPHLGMARRIVDLGSGGGFPALPLAAALSGRPGHHVTMVESVGKKCAFLRDAVERAGLDASVIHARVEAAGHVEADLVTARAFAPLPKLLALARPWLARGAVGLFHKGERWKEELTLATAEWTFVSQAIPGRSGGTGVLLRLSEVSNV